MLRDSEIHKDKGNRCAAKTQVFSQLKSKAERETRGRENKILVRNQSQSFYGLVRQKKHGIGQNKKPNLKCCYGQLITFGTEFKGNLISETTKPNRE